jgi:hypothetical protein
MPGDRLTALVVAYGGSSNIELGRSLFNKGNFMTPLDLVRLTPTDRPHER